MKANCVIIICVICAVHICTSCLYAARIFHIYFHIFGIFLISECSISFQHLSRIWKDKRLTEATKIRLYQALVLSVLMYAAETGTLLAADTGTRSLYVRCQRQILSVRWFDFIRNNDSALRTGLLPVTDLTRSRTPAFSIFSHRPSVRGCYSQPSPTLTSLGRPPHHSWIRRPGRPRYNWLEHIRQDSGISPADLWRRNIKRGHGATLWPRPRDDDDDDGCHIVCCGIIS